MIAHIQCAVDRNARNGFIYDCLIQEPSVLCGVTALARNGLNRECATVLEILTNQVILNNRGTFFLRYGYTDAPIDFEHYVRHMETNAHLLLPTPERAIVESIRDLQYYVDEGVLIESINSYRTNPRICNMELLYEVAQFFNVPRETIEYWWNEAINDREV